MCVYIHTHTHAYVCIYISIYKCIYIANKGPSSQGYGFSSSHVSMWELDYKKSWAPKNWWFWTVVLEKTLESPLDCKEIQPVHPKENQSWIFIGRTDAKTKTLIFWPPDAKSWLIGKDPDTGKDWRQEEKGMIEDEMVGWRHWLNGHEFEQTLGVGDGQGGLECYSPWGHKELDTTEWLNWTDKYIYTYKISTNYQTKLYDGFIFSNVWYGYSLSIFILFLPLFPIHPKLHLFLDVYSFSGSHFKSPKMMFGILLFVCFWG